MFHLVTAIMGIVDSSPSPIPISMDAPTPLASSFRRSLADASPPPPPHPPHPPLLPPLLPPHPPLFPPLLPPPSPPPRGAFNFLLESVLPGCLFFIFLVCCVVCTRTDSSRNPMHNKINTNQKTPNEINPKTPMLMMFKPSP